VVFGTNEVAFPFRNQANTSLKLFSMLYSSEPNTKLSSIEHESGQLQMNSNSRIHASTVVETPGRLSRSASLFLFMMLDVFGLFCPRNLLGFPELSTTPASGKPGKSTAFRPPVKVPEQCLFPPSLILAGSINKFASYSDFRKSTISWSVAWVSTAIFGVADGCCIGICDCDGASDGDIDREFSMEGAID